jgi:hypothetical protein
MHADNVLAAIAAVVPAVDITITTPTERSEKRPNAAKSGGQVGEQTYSNCSPQPSRLLLRGGQHD